jgi:hypothetical protein
MDRTSAQRVLEVVRSSSDISQDLLVNFAAAAVVISVLCGVVERARVGHEDLDDTKIRECAFCRCV